MYLLISLLRSIRSDYAAEIWTGLLGKEVKTPPEVYTSSEMVVALMVMLANGLCFLIKDNRKAFLVALAIGGLGAALIVAGVAAWHYGFLDGFAFMVIVGIGLYLPYVAVHTTIFERLIAMTRDRGNLGYLMYLADSIGYLSYVAVVVVAKLVFGRTKSLDLFALSFFSATCLITALLSLACILWGAVYFRNVGVRTVKEPIRPLLKATGKPRDRATSADTYVG
jgi:hypothetical protein